MKNTEKQQLKRRIKSIVLFLIIVFVPITMLCILLAVVHVPQWLNIMVLVLAMFVLFGLYAFVLSKLDERKQKRMENKKDPFSD